VLAHAIAKQFVQDGVILIPDWHFIEHSAWSKLTETLRTMGKPLRERSETIYWRGTTTGVSCNADYATIDIHNSSILRDPCKGCASLQRVAAVQIAQTSPFLDLTLTSAVQQCQPSHLQELFPSFVVGVGAGSIHNELDWITARGVLDIDGNSNAWGARWRLESGSVLFKVESYITNAYISRMVPYVHYIPISANLSNLASHAQLVRGELVLPTLEVIVQNSNQLMAEFTYEKEVTRVRKELLKMLTGQEK
jgi:Glycosyl transferase family 90